MSIDEVNEKEIKVSTTQAYSDGFMAAIFRKSENTNPYKNSTLNAKAWEKGHESGQGVVTFHTTRIRTPKGSGGSWWYNL